MQEQVSFNLPQRTNQGQGFFAALIQALSGTLNRVQTLPGNKTDQCHQRQGDQHFYQREAKLSGIVSSVSLTHGIPIGCIALHCTLLSGTAKGGARFDACLSLECRVHRSLEVMPSSSVRTGPLPRRTRIVTRRKSGLGVACTTCSHRNPRGPCGQASVRLPVAGNTACRRLSAMKFSAACWARLLSCIARVPFAPTPSARTQAASATAAIARATRTSTRVNPCWCRFIAVPRNGRSPAGAGGLKCHPSEVP